ncbi:MAG: hypothetical protein K6E53_04330 [Lachnospiraceae bacterium]|nr:hypothetical protein [Lachnospiraceae bacterium]
MSNASEKSLTKLKEIMEEDNNLKEYIRLKDGLTIYGLKMTTFRRIAKRAGAFYKVGSVVLINKRIFDAYLSEHKGE